MKRHHTKQDFQVVAVTVIALEVIAFILFLLGMSLAVYNMFLFPPLFTNIGVITVVVGSTIGSFLILAVAEFLQLLMKIEVNTRKEKVVKAPVKKAVKKVVAKKKPAKKKA